LHSQEINLIFNICYFNDLGSAIGLQFTLAVFSANTQLVGFLLGKDAYPVVETH